MPNLLTTLSPDALNLIKAVVRAVEAAFPLKAKHRSELPYAVQDLSRLLTVERSRKEAYWASPRLTGAYLYYFLPWNLLRAGFLLPGLPLTAKPGLRLLDLGSGPLTLPLALWLARPDFRAEKLRLTCTDLSPHPLQLGKDIFTHLPGGSPAWEIELRRSTLEEALRKTGPQDLILAGNVLNELPTPRKETLSQRLEELVERMEMTLAPGGRILLLEPGTRLGGKLISIFRSLALERGFVVEAPCPHDRVCPLLATHEFMSDEAGAPDEDAPRTRRAQGQPHGGGWCHFSCAAEGAPEALLRLSEAARLPKQALHLSCLLLRKPDKAESPARTGGPDTALLRIVSDPIALPGQTKTARYACSARGLVLLREAGRLPSGALVHAAWPQEEIRDRKSGALELTMKQARETRRSPTAGGQSFPQTDKRQEAERCKLDATLKKRERNAKSGGSQTPSSKERK